MTGEESEADVGDDCVFVANHSGKQFFTGGEEFLEVLANFLFDSTGFPAGCAEFSEI